MTGYAQPPEGIDLGEVKTITCRQCLGNPPPTFEWYHVDTPIGLTAETPAVDADWCSESTFALPPAASAHNGKYFTCSADNNISPSTSKNISMNVLGKVKIKQIKKTS